MVSPSSHAQEYPRIFPARRWEDKFDAKGFRQHNVVIRCMPPAGKRKVPLYFDGWVLMLDANSHENPFANCQLVQDRPIVGGSFTALCSGLPGISHIMHNFQTSFTNWGTAISQYSQLPQPQLFYLRPDTHCQGQSKRDSLDTGSSVCGPHC